MSRIGACTPCSTNTVAAAARSASRLRRTPACRAPSDSVTVPPLSPEQCSAKFGGTRFRDYGRTTGAREGSTPMSIDHTPQQIVAVKPITVPSPGRDLALQVKVTAPVPGRDLPVIVFSHGNAWSMDGYEPLVDRWAVAGFVVVQPTHLDSRRNRIGFDDPRFATLWRVRIADLHAVLDHLGAILDEVPGLPTRVDHTRVAVVGHSWGGQ